MKHHLFISYRHPDDNDAAAIEAALTERGFECWRDPRIPWGADFPRVIERAIDNSQAVLVLLSEESGYSRWIGREIRMAQSRGRPVLPVMLGDAELPDELKARLERLHHKRVRDGEFDDDIRELAAELRNIGIGSLEDDIDTELIPRYVEEAFPTLSPFDHERLEAIAGWTSQRFLGVPRKGFWTTHGLRHSNGIIRHLRDLAGDRIRGDNEAAFCLATAACLHDAGLVQRKITTQNGDEEVARETIGLPLRRDHHKRSETLVRSLAGEMLLTGREARIVADICHYHNSRTNARELSENPDVAELVSLFRIANACDLGPVRAPAFFWTWKREAIWPEKAGEKANKDSEELPEYEKDAALTFWLRNLSVNEVHIDRDDREITLCCHAPSPDLFFIPGQVHNYLQRTVEQLAPFIGVWKVDFQPVEVDEDASVLSMEDMVKLGAHMYSDPEAVLRSSSDIGEYLVRSVLALTGSEHVQKAREAASDGTPKGAEIRQSSGAAEGHSTGENAGGKETSEPDEEIVNTLQKLFDTLPPKRRELHYLQWLQEEFKRVRGAGETPAAQITDLHERFEQIHEMRHLYPALPPADAKTRCPFTAISRRAYQRLDKGRQEKDIFTVFVFGRSGPVCAFIEYCAGAGKRIRVRTPVMRPAAEGPTLKVVEGLEDVHGVHVEVVPDAAIPYILNGDVEAGVEGCDVALVGCEAIVTGEKSCVASSLGALAVAQMVKRSSCQLWVLSEESKKFAADISCWRPDSDSSCGALPASFFMHEAAASRVAADSPMSYPRSEIIPHNLVDLLITENDACPLADAAPYTREPE